MKKNMLVAAGITLALAFFLNDSRAQDNPPPASPTPGAPAPGQPAPGAPGAPMQRPMMPPHSRGPVLIMRSINDLRMVKMELQHAQDDLGGHKDSAIEAVDKAMQELEAVRKAMPMPTPPPRGGPRVGQPPAAAPAPGAPPSAQAPAQPSAPPATTPPQ